MQPLAPLLTNRDPVAWVLVQEHLVASLDQPTGVAAWAAAIRELPVTQEVLGLGPFLESLERQLDELPAEQLRRLLLEHGAWLPPGERASFLQVFDTPGTGHDDAESGFPGAGTPEELICSDVSEAKHRYLRSVGESEPLATRATALVEAAN